MTFRRALGVVVIATAIAGPIVEIFDRWDDTLNTGNDTEGASVVLALCAGLAITAAAARQRSPSPLRVTTQSNAASPDARPVTLLVGLVLVASSPPPQLRI